MSTQRYYPSQLDSLVGDVIVFGVDLRLICCFAQSVFKKD